MQLTYNGCGEEAKTEILVQGRSGCAAGRGLAWAGLALLHNLGIDKKRGNLNV